MRTLDQPIVGAINGVAAGRRRLARVRLRPAGRGRGGELRPRVRADRPRADSGATWFLPRLVGPAKAAELALLGEPLSAADAERFGLVARVVPAETLAEAARAIAARLAALAPLALAQTKRALEPELVGRPRRALEDEAYRQGIAGATADHAEGLRRSWRSGRLGSPGSRRGPAP